MLMLCYGQHSEAETCHVAVNIFKLVSHRQTNGRDLT